LVTCVAVTALADLPLLASILGWGLASVAILYLAP